MTSIREIKSLFPYAHRDLGSVPRSVAISVAEPAADAALLCPHCEAPQASFNAGSTKSHIGQCWLNDGNLLANVCCRNSAFDQPRAWEVFWWHGECWCCRNHYYVMEAITLTILMDKKRWIGFHGNERQERDITAHKARYDGPFDLCPNNWYFTAETLQKTAQLLTHFIGPFPADVPDLAARIFFVIKNDLLSLASKWPTIQQKGE